MFLENYMLRIQSTFTQLVRSFVVLSFLSVSLLGLSACDSEPPTLMKASKQFESDEIRDKHVAHMRKNHMDELMHKRDETVYDGIRTKKYSLNACINCHVPEQHNGEVLRHTNPEHFCSTCHGYVAAKLDCFQCHVDHPVKQEATADATPQSPEQQGDSLSIAQYHQTIDESNKKGEISE